MSLAKETKFYKAFTLSIGLTVALVLSGIFLGTAVWTGNLINESNIVRARALFNSIFLARQWNAHYGGVFVEKKEGMKSNPYLEEPDISTADGRVLMRKNPALMARELSEYAESEGLYKFNITSLKPLNPTNKPDRFERTALSLFEKGQKEVFRTELIDGRAHFRYMAPLHVDRSCLQCHAKQGYRVGDIRGGISITFDIEDIQVKLKKNTLLIIMLAVSVTSSLLGLLYLFTMRLTGKVSAARCEIERFATTDGLTGISNRRHLIERFEEEFERAGRLKKDLGCIILDIDHFKAINDSGGHFAGDEVLKEVAGRIRDAVRTYDLFGRYGGEEFMIVLPDAGFEDTKVFAQRIRKDISETPIRGLKVTISLGIASIHDTDKSVDDIIKRADDGLYLAKRNGRDRLGWV